MSEVHGQATNYPPLKCEENGITLLARDPNWLYVYWQIPESKKNAFLQDFGHEFFGKSMPVLKVTNVSKNESFYIRINDFSNNWYINVPDSNSLYIVEIGRRVSEHFFVSMANSNSIVTPGDNVSPNTRAYFVNYTDLRNGKLDMEMGKAYEACSYKNKSMQISGLSSPELFGMEHEESYFGESSMKLYETNAAGQLGVSSESFIK